MGARNIRRLVQEFLVGAEQFDLESGEVLAILPKVDDQGSINVGDGSTDMDVKVFLGATTSTVTFDVGTSQVDFEGTNLHFGDTDLIEFGDATAGDFTIGFDGTQLEILPTTDDTGAVNFGDGTTDADVKVFLGLTTDYVLADVGNKFLEIAGTVRPKGFNAPSSRFELSKVFGTFGKPGLNADILNATEATRMIADRDFEVLGTNATSASTAIGVEGGITLTTAGADGDGVIILPHLDASSTAWQVTTWGTDKEVIWECHISTNGNITNEIIWAGLKLTNTPTVATDDDQVFFRYEDDVASGVWQAVDSIGGTDTSTNTSVTVAVSTEYHLKIIIDSSRIATFYINGALVRTTSALTDTTDLIPYVGVEADGAAAAKSISLYSQAISRVMG